jgi:hypothetical protein
MRVEDDMFAVVFELKGSWKQLRIMQMVEVRIEIQALLHYGATGQDRAPQAAARCTNIQNLNAARLFVAETVGNN